MIKCPRCGFTQPKDRYCAQCGLDIETYSPPEIPFTKKFFGDPFLQLSAVLIIALASGFYVYKNNKSEIHDRVKFFSQGIQYSRNNSSSLPAAPSRATEGQAADQTNDQQDVPQQLMTASEATAPSPADTGSSVTPTGTAVAAAGGGAENAAPKADANKNQIQIQYVEVTDRVLDQIYADSRQSGQFNSLGDHVAGLWPQGRKKLTMSGMKFLTKESKVLEVGKTIQFFAGLKGNEPENDLGLSTYVEVSGFDQQGLHGHLEVVRAWREATPENPNSIQRRFYPAPIDIPADAEFFLAGLLPRGSAMDNDPYLTNIDPFKILKSNAFKNHLAEFMILVDFDKSGP